jgi:alpha-tubulin suppressor-like RCC1 family protein
MNLSRTAPALVLAACLGLAACSGGGSTTSPSTANSASASNPSRAGSSTVYRWGVVGNRGKIAQLELGAPTPVAGISGHVVQIATSNSDGYALTAAGEVWAWGVASYGELGDGQAIPYDIHAARVEFPAGVKIVALANPMPFDAALAIDSHGHVWGWGLNAAGDLCLSQLLELRPARLPLAGVTLATGARTHSLFYAGRTVYACGSGDAGELGTGSTASSAKPVPVVGLPRNTTVTALTSSWEGSGALLSTGAYYDWGYNAVGQLGDARTTNSATPVQVKLPGPVRQVSQGGSGAANGQTVALLANGSVWAWGNNEHGQLGDGSTVSSDVPVRVKVPAQVSVLTVDSGGYACYAIDNSGRLWAWGGNKNGQLGTGSDVLIEAEPVEVSIRLAQISSTASNVAGLK